MARAEQEDLAYLFRLRTTTECQSGAATGDGRARLDGCRPGLARQGDDSLRLVGWSRQRRVILLRRKLIVRWRWSIAPILRSRGSALPRSGRIGEVWEYAALVTSLDSEILTLGQLYRDRATARTRSTS